MPKAIIILQRKPRRTRGQCHEHWASEHHTAIVGRIPELTRWVQDRVVSAPAEPAACDGVGELWFDSDEPLQAALGSPEMGAAVEYAPNFLDMKTTGLVVVDEITIVR